MGKAGDEEMTEQEKTKSVVDLLESAYDDILESRNAGWDQEEKMKIDAESKILRVINILEKPAEDCINRADAIEIAEKYGLSNGSALGHHSGIADQIAQEIGQLLSVPLIEEEPRVMTLEELRDKAPVSEPLYLEDMNGKTGWALKCAPTREGWTTLALHHNRGTIASFKESEYLKKWRCWTSFAINDLREAVPWVKN